MFEPKSYYEKRLMVLEGLVVSLISALPQESLQYIQGPYHQFLNQTTRLKNQEADNQLGDNPVPAADRPSEKWIQKVLTDNLGRTVFANKLRGSSLEGAIGTKSFGQKYVPWIRSLPEIDQSWAPDMATGFYQDSGQTRSEKDLPMLTLVINTPDQLIVLAVVGARHYAAQLFKSLIPANFNWEFARDEFFGFRAQITRGEFLQGLAAALVAQERPAMALEEQYVDVVRAAYPQLDLVVVSDDLEVEVLAGDELVEANNELKAEVDEAFQIEQAAINAGMAAAMPAEVAAGIDSAIDQGVAVTEQVLASGSTEA